jgi:hypothetical protein
MNRSLSQPFVVGLLLTDLMLVVTFMLIFRNDNTLALEGTFLARRPSNLVPIIGVHYVVRKACEALSFLLISNAPILGVFCEIVISYLLSIQGGLCL